MSGRGRESYMGTQVDKSGLASDKALQAMLKEMQELYAQTFRTLIHSYKF